MSNLVSKLVLLGTDLLEPLLEVEDLPLELDDLIFLLIEQTSVIEVSRSVGILDGELNTSAQETINLVFNEQQSLIEVVSLLALELQTITSAEEVLAESKDSVLQAIELGIVAGTVDDHVTFGAPAELVHGSFAGQIEGLTFEVLPAT